MPLAIVCLAFAVDPIMSEGRYDGLHVVISGLLLQLLCELTLASGPGTFFVLFMTNLATPVLDVVRRNDGRRRETNIEKKEMVEEEENDDSIPSVLSLMWAFHALIAKPLNAVGPILGAYFLIEADIDPFEEWNRRSHVHMNNMRKNFKTLDDMTCLPVTLKMEKKWIALAMTGRIDKKTHAISNSAIGSFEDPPEMKKTSSTTVHSQLMRNINQDRITIGRSAVGGFKGQKVGQQSTRNAVSFQLSAAEQLKHLEQSNLAMTGENIVFRRKRTTIRKKPKRSRSDLEATGYDDKMDGVRGRHGPEKRKMFTAESKKMMRNKHNKNVKSKNSRSTLSSLESSSLKKKQNRGRKKKNLTKSKPKKSLSSKSSQQQSDGQKKHHPNQVDDNLLILPSLSFRSSNGDRSYTGGDHSFASIDSGGRVNSFNFNPMELDLALNMNYSSLPSLDQFPSISSIADSLDDIAITPRLMKDLVEGDEETMASLKP
eukprot:g3344.t1